MNVSAWRGAVTCIAVALSTAGVGTAAAQDADDSTRHPSVRIGSLLRLDILARLQLDARLRSGGPVDDEEGFDVARKRIGMRGRFGRVVSFELEGELEADSPWRDAYVEYRQLSAIRARAGRFKVPFNRDQSTSSTNLDFIHRSLAAEQLAPRRETGVMVHGRVWRGRVKYETGMFGDSRTVAARVAATPFARHRSPLSRFSTAVAFVSSTGGERLLESVWINGTRQRAGLELRFEPGPLALTTEYMRAIDERQGQSVGGEDLPALTRAGWYVSGVWRFRKPLLTRHVRVQVAARVEELRVGSGLPEPGASRAVESFGPRAAEIAGREERAVTLGADWLVGRWVKLQVNAVRHTGRAPSSAQATGSRWSPMLRFQFVL